MPYTSCSSAISLISMPTRVSVSVTISAGKAGARGSNDHNPPVAPAAGGDRGRPLGRPVDEGVGHLVGGLVRELGLQLVAVPDRKPRGQYDDLVGQPPAAEPHSAPGRARPPGHHPGPASGCFRPASGQSFAGPGPAPDQTRTGWVPDQVSAVLADRGAAPADGRTTTAHA